MAKRGPWNFWRSEGGPKNFHNKISSYQAPLTRICERSLSFNMMGVTRWTYWNHIWWYEWVLPEGLKWHNDLKQVDSWKQKWKRHQWLEWIEALSTTAEYPQDACDDVPRLAQNAQRRYMQICRMIVSTKCGYGEMADSLYFEQNKHVSCHIQDLGGGWVWVLDPPQNGIFWIQKCLLHPLQIHFVVKIDPLTDLGWGKGEGMFHPLCVGLLYIGFILLGVMWST